MWPYQFVLFVFHYQVVSLTQESKPRSTNIREANDPAAELNFTLAWTYFKPPVVPGPTKYIIESICIIYTINYLAVDVCQKVLEVASRRIWLDTLDSPRTEALGCQIQSRQLIDTPKCTFCYDRLEGQGRSPKRRPQTGHGLSLGHRLNLYGWTTCLNNNVSKSIRKFIIHVYLPKLSLINWPIEAVGPAP